MRKKTIQTQLYERRNAFKRHTNNIYMYIWDQPRIKRMNMKNKINGERDREMRYFNIRHSIDCILCGVYEFVCREHAWIQKKHRERDSARDAYRNYIYLTGLTFSGGSEQTFQMNYVNWTSEWNRLNDTGAHVHNWFDG